MKTCPVCNSLALTRFVVSFTPMVEDGQTVWNCSVEPMAS